jgi:hypothetical protein
VASSPLTTSLTPLTRGLLTRCEEKPVHIIDEISSKFGISVTRGATPPPPSLPPSLSPSPSLSHPPPLPLPPLQVSTRRPVLGRCGGVAPRRTVGGGRALRVARARRSLQRSAGFLLPACGLWPRHAHRASMVRPQTGTRQRDVMNSSGITHYPEAQQLLPRNQRLGRHVSGSLVWWWWWRAKVVVGVGLPGPTFERVCRPGPSASMGHSTGSAFLKD